jgi:hypothetical protein
LDHAKGASRQNRASGRQKRLVVKAGERFNVGERTLRRYQESGGPRSQAD